MLSDAEDVVLDIVGENGLSSAREKDGEASNVELCGTLGTAGN